MAWAFAADFAKEHLGLALPGHLGEFINGGDQQAGQAAVDFLIDHYNGQAFIRRLARRKFTLPERVRAVLECAPASTFVNFDCDVVGAERPAAPGAVGQLQWCAFAAQTHPLPFFLADGFSGIFRPVGRGAHAHPQPNSEGFRAPAGGFLAADKLHGTNQGCGALKLLQGQQAQGVPHQHSHTGFTGVATHFSLQTAQGHGKGGHAKVSFGLAAAGGEPEQVGFGMRGIDAIRVGWVK